MSLTVINIPVDRVPESEEETWRVVEDHRVSVGRKG